MASTIPRSVAFHEAGHAVMAVIVGRPIQKVSIGRGQLNSVGTWLGNCKIGKGRSKPSSDCLEDEVLLFLAGMVAESHVTGAYCKAGAAEDLRVVKRLLSVTRANSQQHLQKLEDRLLKKTERLLSEPQHLEAVELVAEELIKKRAISGKAVVHFYRQATLQRKGD